ncbi:MAG: hypothetical protein WA347_07375 [Rhabdochlamydiaceae bacterium]
MSYQPIQISSPKAEGIMQVSKWLKVQVLLDSDEMEALIKELGDLFFVIVSDKVKLDEAVIAPRAFLEKYADYVDLLKQGQLPPIEEFRRIFSCGVSADLEIFYAMEVSGDRFLIRPKKPVLQLQAHHFFYSTLDRKFHPMVLSPDSISWGLQITYPQLYQDQITHQVVKVINSPDFPNTAVFTKLLKWMRSFTLPTPFEVDGRQTNSPIRIGKQSLAWIKNHPQLKQRGIEIVKFGE